MVPGLEKTDRFVLHCKEFQCSFFLSHSSKNVFFFSFLSGSVISESEFGLISLLGVILMYLENPSALSAGHRELSEHCTFLGVDSSKARLCWPPSVLGFSLQRHFGAFVPDVQPSCVSQIN